MEYNINKGIGRNVEFNGLQAQYLYFFVGGLLAIFLLFVIFYMIGIDRWFWLFGFGIMFGDGKFIGAYKGIADSTYASAAPDGVPFFAFLIFQTVFCATAATIVSGAMAERTKFISYCIYSAIISLLVYPIEAHWIWGGGWLADLGFHDFAGSTCVHMAGGVAAFVGAAILGPRIGKYEIGRAHV